MLQASSTIHRTSTYVECHWATLTSTIVSRTTEYSTVTAAPSTVYDVVTVSSVLTEVSPLPLRWSQAPERSPVSFPNADLLSVLNRYGYAISAHHFCNHAGEAYELVKLRGRISIANAGFQITTLVRAPPTTTEFETQTINSVCTQVCLDPCSKLVASWSY
jgi:hypothetical protein